LTLSIADCRFVKSRKSKVENQRSKIKGQKSKVKDRISNRQSAMLIGRIVMSGLTGLEKFSHLEDKIYRTIELIKTLRQEKDALEREVNSTRREIGTLLEEKDRLELQVERLLSERDAIRLKVEAMLDAIAALDPETAEAMRQR
jgi:FtsZ-binding cell division protein ZapB